MISFFSSISGKNEVTHIYFIGESNSGGIARNVDALSSELDEDPNIQIWDNISNDGFFNLDIGTNNLLGHAGLESYASNSHGWELQMQNRVSDLGTPCFLTKCGQGGSRISQWGTGGTYWQTFLTRSNGSKAALQNRNVNTYVFVSLGINDASDGKDPATWYNEVYTWLVAIKAQTGAIKMGITEIMENDANYVAINAEIDNLVSVLPYLFKVQTSDATQRDSKHWDYAGMKLIADRMIDLI